MFNNRWFSIAVGSGLAVLLLSGRPVLPEGLFRHLARSANRVDLSSPKTYHDSNDTLKAQKI